MPVESNPKAANAPCRLPAHLGWGSPAETAVLHARSTPEPTEPVPAAQPPAASQAQTATKVEEPETAVLPETTRLYPDLALAILRRNVVAPGRLWLLLRALDKEGRGVFRIAEIRNTLTDKSNSIYLCGKRQLRNLLKQGEKLFWQRDGERLWLRGAARVAARLSVPRLSARPVELPISVLLGRVGEVKAHFYASFHSGRKQAPISRETLSELTGVPARTQLRYEAETGVNKQHNLAVGERLSAARMEERAWARGTAVFTFIDYTGRHGPTKQQYIAWHLPNSYDGPHALSRRGRMRKINRKLKDLVNKQARGNNSDRVFFADGGSAARARTRQPRQRDVYWPQHHRGSCALWCCG